MYSVEYETHVCRMESQCNDILLKVTLSLIVGNGNQSFTFYFRN